MTNKPKGKCNHEIRVKFNIEDYNTIAERAEKAGLSVVSYARWLLLNARLKVQVEE